MNTIPLFLQLVKANTLLYAIILSKDLSLIKNYPGEYRIVSETFVEIYNFKLTETDSFHLVFITLDQQDSSLHVAFCTDSPKYFDHAPEYFGENTVYKPIEHLLKAKNLEIPEHKKYTYQFTELSPPVSVRVRPGINGGVSVTFHNGPLKPMFEIPEGH